MQNQASDTVENAYLPAARSKQQEALADIASISDERPHPSLWALFTTWCKIGVISFGGGSATLLLIQRECVERLGWATEEEYSRYWSLSQISPGIVMFATMILMFRKLGGWKSVIVSFAGLLIPSALITILFSAVFEFIRNLPTVQAMLRGVIPATAGVMLALSIQFARPLVKKSYQTDALSLIECALIIIGSACALIFWHVEVVLVMLGAALLSVGIFLPLRTWLVPGSKAIEGGASK